MTSSKILRLGKNASELAFFARLIRIFALIMLEKLAKQTAVYGISTIVVRFLSYLLTPYYTRIFGQETYGIVTDVYALSPWRSRC